RRESGAGHPDWRPPDRPLISHRPAARAQDKKSGALNLAARRLPVSIPKPDHSCQALSVGLPALAALLLRQLERLSRDVILRDHIRYFPVGHFLLVKKLQVPGRDLTEVRFMAVAELVRHGDLPAVARRLQGNARKFWLQLVNCL